MFVCDRVSDWWKVWITASAWCIDTVGGTRDLEAERHFCFTQINNKKIHTIGFSVVDKQFWVLIHSGVRGTEKPQQSRERLLQLSALQKRGVSHMQHSEDINTKPDSQMSLYNTADLRGSEFNLLEKWTYSHSCPMGKRLICHICKVIKKVLNLDLLDHFSSERLGVVGDDGTAWDGA